MATSGVLFMNMLAVAAPNMVTRSAARGCLLQNRASCRVMECNAPVTSSALEQMSSATIVISAGLPKPARKSFAPSGPLLLL